jgi:signal peptidase II
VKSKKVSLGLFFASACVVFLVDAVSKLAVARTLEPGASVRVLGDVVRLTHVKNFGASFGLFPGSTLTLIVISSVAVLIVFALALHSMDRTSQMILLGLIMGGALGNLFDRVRLGGVIDFVDIGVGSIRWPVFNAADVAVTLGVILLLLQYLRRSERSREPSQGEEWPGA